MSDLLSPGGGLNFIEQLQMASQKFCEKESRPYLVGVSEADKTVVLTRPNCNQWNCTACAARNAKRWIARIINHINLNASMSWKFVTLTAHEKYRGEAASVKNLRQGWKKFYNRMIWRYGTEDYAKVWERHADGSFHLHGLFGDSLQDGQFWIEDYPYWRGISQRWAKNNARACGMGHQVKVRPVENAGQVAGYISKYMVKSEEIGGYPRDLRRIEVSRNWTKLPDLHADTLIQWIVQDTREGQLLRAGLYHTRGFDIIDTPQAKQGN